MADDVIIINTPPSIRRKKSRKKPRFRIAVETTPLIHDFSAIARNPGPPEAVRAELEKRIKAVGKPVSVATLARRQRYVREFGTGRQAAQRRYGASRTRKGTLRKGGVGDTPPVPGASYWFNDSGRLAENLVVRSNPKLDEFSINMAGNRFDATTFGNLAQFEEMLRQFELLVQPSQVITMPDVTDAISAALIDAIQSQIQRNANAKRALQQARLRAFGSALNLLRVFI